MDGIERRFNLGTSEHRDEVSEASITACRLLSDGSLPASEALSIRSKEKTPAFVRGAAS